MRECSGSNPVRELKETSEGAARRTFDRSLVFNLRFECERIRWDPKDGELCLCRAKHEETRVEARSDSNVQIDRQIWV